MAHSVQKPHVLTTDSEVEYLEERIARLAIELGWAPPTVEYLLEGTWKGRTRATKDSIKSKPNLGLKPLAVYPLEEHTTCYICETSLALYKAMTLDCDHIYCHECLKTNYETAIKNPDWFPPRCCMPLNFERTAFVLSNEQIDELLTSKSRHESTKIMNCAYCEKEIFNGITSISESAAYCLSCKKLTCVTCGKEMHKDVCPESQGVEELAMEVKKSGWSVCPRCNRVIEKVGGCNHIYCLCGLNFCYLCREKLLTGLGDGCKCHQKRLPQEFPRGVSLGESFQSADAEDDSIRGEWAYNQLISDHKKEAARKQRELKKIRNAILLTREENMEELRIAEEIMELRGQVRNLRAKMDGREADKDEDDKIERKKTTKGRKSAADKGEVETTENMTQERTTRSQGKRARTVKVQQAEDPLPPSASTRASVRKRAKGTHSTL